MIGDITLNPMNPQTTEGMAASSSITTFRVSLVLPVQNSETKMAAPTPKGTAMTMARKVTLKVPTISAPTPNLVCVCEVGNHSVEKRNSLILSLARKGFRRAAEWLKRSATPAKAE